LADLETPYAPPRSPPISGKSHARMPEGKGSCHKALLL
jgi:hypothetical protein